MPRLRHSFRVVSAVAALSAMTALLSCADEEKDTRLFEEDGVWLMMQYSLAGAASETIDPNSRENDIMMKFDSSNNTVATASCYVTDGGVVNDSLGDGGCKTNSSLAEWYCRCFAYTYGSNEMVWLEFDPGTERPEEIIDPDDGGGDDGGTDTTGTGGGGGAGVGTKVFVDNVEDSQDKVFGPLPMGLWESDGTSSKYTFRQKADSIWSTPQWGAMSPNVPDNCASACGLTN
jgi:hypothetical protein